jgi:hypothetical protein
VLGATNIPVCANEKPQGTCRLCSQNVLKARKGSANCGTYGYDPAGHNYIALGAHDTREFGPETAADPGAHVFGGLKQSPRALLSAGPVLSQNSVDVPTPARDR